MKIRWHSKSSKTSVLLMTWPSKAKSVRKMKWSWFEAYYLPTWVSKTFAQKSLFATRNIYKVTKTNWVSHEACMSSVDTWETHVEQIFWLSPVACDWKLSLFATDNWFDKPHRKGLNRPRLIIKSYTTLLSHLAFPCHIIDLVVI